MYETWVPELEYVGGQKMCRRFLKAFKVHTLNEESIYFYTFYTRFP